MIPQNRYFSSLLLSFSTFLENEGVSELLAAEATRVFSQVAKLALDHSPYKSSLSDVEIKSQLGSLTANPRLRQLIAHFATEYSPAQASVFTHEFMLALKADGCSPATIRNYRSDINQFFEFVGLHDIAATFTKPKLAEFVAFQKQKGLKDSSVERKLKSLNQFGEWLGQELLINGSPVDDYHISSYQQPAQAATATVTRPAAQASRFSQPAAVITPTPAINPLTLAQPEIHQPSIIYTAAEKKASGVVQKQEKRARLKSRLTAMAGRVRTQSRQLLLSYFNLALLVVFFLGLSVLGYQQFFRDVDTPLAYPSAPVTPNRVLSFQGRLTDSADNPITVSTNMRFYLYDTGPGTGGTELWDSGTCAVTPDQDGIFSVGLGSDCGTEITEDVFTENANVWLEVEIATETLSPRQQIKAVAYALNSETVQGFPVNASESATINTILVMNEFGEVVLGEVSPTLKSVSGTFYLEGQTLQLQTASGSNGDIVFAPDGNGEVISEAYFSAPGATLSATYAGGNQLRLRYDDTYYTDFRVDASGQLSILPQVQNDGNQTALIVNTSGLTGGSDLFELRNNGTERFRVDNGGSVYQTGSLNLTSGGNGNIYFGGITSNALSNSSNTLTLQAANDLIFNIDSNNNSINQFSFRAAGTEIINIDESGNTSLLAQSDLRLYDSDSSNYLALQAPGTVSSNITYTLPGSVTDGYILQTDSSGTLSWADPTALTGAATYWTQNAGALFPKNSTVDFLVGGQSSASAKFAVLNVNTGTPTASIAGSTAGYGLSLTGDGTIATTLNRSLLLNPSGGNVGIGTTSAGGVLEVYKDQAYAGTVESMTQIRVNNPSATGFSAFSIWGNGSERGRMQYNASSPNIFFTTRGTIPFYIGTNDAIRLTVDGSSGNVGIGTTTVSARLHSLSTTEQLRLGYNASNYTSLYTTSGGDLTIAPSGGDLTLTGDLIVSGTTTFNSVEYTWPGADGSTGQVLSTDGAGTLSWTSVATDSNIFWSQANGAIFPKNSTVDFLVGGQSSASAKFAVLNVNSGTPTASIAGSTAGNALSLTGDGTIATTLNRSLLLNPSGGFVGIGTSSPEAKLHVASGNLLLSNNQPIQFEGTNNANYSILNYNSSDNVVLANPQAANIIFQTNGTTERMRITSGGNIGIDTTSPLARLSINGDLKANAATISATYAGGTPLTLQGGPTGTANLLSLQNSSGTALSVFDEAGYLGIGTSNPSSILDISGSSNPTLTLTNTSGPSSYTIQQLSGATITNSTGTSVTNRIGGNNILSYSATLVNSLVPLQAGYSGTAADPAIKLTNANIGFFQADTSTLGISTGGTERMRIDSSGNVGIGTTTVSARLHSLSTTEQLRLGYDASNYASFTTSSGGDLTIAPSGGDTTITGDIIVSGTTTFNSVEYTWPGADGSSGQVLSTNGAGTLSWTSAATDSSIHWALSNGSLYPKNSTVDFLVGGQSTASAKFAVLNVNNGTPVASVSTGTSGTAAYLTAGGNLQTANRLTLALGGTTTGNVAINNTSGTEFTRFDTTNSRVGIGTTAPASSLQVIGESRFGDASNYGVFSSSGDLTFASGGDYLVGAGGNDWAFRYSVDEDAGLFFNVTNTRLEFRNTNGARTFSAEVGPSSGRAFFLNSIVAGGISEVNYNAFSDSGTTSRGLSSDDDVYIEDLLEVDGAAYFDSSITVVGTTTLNGVAYTWPGADGSSGQVLSTNGAGTLSWTSAATDSSIHWSSTLGSLYPKNSTLDFFIGGQSTASAKFAVLNVNSGTPTASIAGSTAGNALSLTGDGTIATTLNRSLLLNPNGGNVGIGTTDPGYSLVINGTANSGDNNQIQLQDQGSAFGYLYGSSNGQYLQLVSSVSGLNLAATGRVAIDDSSSGSGNSTILGTAISTDSFIANKSLIILGNNNTSDGDFRISGGNVGIGTTTISARLHSLSTTEQLRLGYDASNYASFTTSSGGDLTIAPSGGDTTITGDLIVSGTTTFNSVEYTWPGADGSSGQVLSTDGAGTLSWTSAATDSNIFWNQANGALFPKNSTVDFLVGGQSTASAKFAVLNVNNGTPTASISSGTSGNAAYLTSTGNLQTARRQTLSLGGTTTGNITLNNTSGTEFARFDTTNGRLGIGTTAPGAYLDVTGSNTASTNSLRLRGGDNDTAPADSNQILFAYDGGVSYQHALRTRHNSLSDQGNAIDFYLWDAGTDAAGTVGTKHVLTLDSQGTGYVGLGTTSPENKAHIIETSAGALAYALKLENKGTTNDSATGILFGVDSGSGRGKGGIIYNRTSTFNRGDLHFLQDSGANTDVAALADSAMVIKNDGTVGIGTTTTSARLHTLSTTEQLRLGYDASNYASFTTSSGGDLTIAPSGGDTNITGTLTLSGDLAVNGDDITTDGSLTITPTTTLTLNSTGNLTLDSSTDILLDADGADIIFQDGGATFATFTNSSTDLTLDIAGGQFLLANGDVFNIGGVTGQAYNTISDSGTASFASTDDDLYIEDILEVGSTLYVGGTAINSNSLWANTLNVYHPANAYAEIADIMAGGTATDSANIHFSSRGWGVIDGNRVGRASLILNQQAGDQDLFVASVSGTNRFRITNEGYVVSQRFNDLANTSYFLDPAATGTSLAVAGSVGINTTAPTAKLEVWGDTILNAGTQDFDTRIAGDTDANLFFADASTDRIGIGTNTPASKLQVIGESRFGEATTNYAAFASDGDLTLNGNADYLVGNNRYAFRSSAAPNAGVFFNSSGLLYEFRSTGGSALATIGVNSGNASFNGSLDVLGAATFNENSTDVDFRIESNNNDNMFFLDAGNDRIGIGTNAPSALLDVRGAAVFNDANADADFRIEGVNDTNLFYADASTNRIGIGTSTPNAKLNLVYTSTSTTAGTDYGTYLSLADTGVVTTGTDTTYGLYNTVTRTGATGGTINTYGNYINLVTDNAGSGTSNAYGLYVNLDGNADNDYAGVFNGGFVGIGTTTPLKEFHIQASVEDQFLIRRPTTADLQATGMLFGVGDTSVTSDAYQKAGIFFQRDDSSFNSVTGGFGKGKLILAVNNTANSTNATLTDAVMTLEPDGDVGIGTTSPTAPLHAYKNQDVLARLDHASATGNPTLAFMQTGTVRSLIEYRNSNTDLRLRNPYGEIGLYTGTAGTANIALTIETDGDLNVEGSLTLDVPAATAGYIYGICHSTNGAQNNADFTDCDGSATDIAEYYMTAGSDVGDVLVTGTTYDTEGNLILQKSTGKYQPGILGVVSTYPTGPNGAGLGEDLLAHKPGAQPVGLVGRVPVKVSTENGPIKPGDALTTSSTTGVAMKATQPGPIIGYALEHYDGSVKKSAGTLLQEQKRQEGMPQLPAPQPLPAGVGKILVFSDPGWHEPSYQLTDSGDFVITGSSSNYQVSQSGSTLSNVLGAAEGIFAKVRAGLVETQEAIASIRVRTPRVETNLITPMAGNNLAVQLGNNDGSSKFQVQNNNGQTVAQIDDRGNTTLLGKLIAPEATISGNLGVAGTTTTNKLEATSARIAALEAGMAQINQIKAQNAELSTATISGTLYAANIDGFQDKVAESLKQPTLLEQLMAKDPMASNSASMAKLFQIVEEAGYTATGAASLNKSLADLNLDTEDVSIQASAAFINSYFEVNGNIFADGSLGVTQQIMVGEGLIIGDGVIQQVATASNPTGTLYLQPAGGKLNLANGTLLIADGQVEVNGTLRIKGDVQVEDTLLTDLLKPTDYGNPLQVQVAGVATESGEVQKSRFEIINEIGTPVATISAEGRATFAGGLGVGAEDLSGDTDGTADTAQTSGRATVAAGQTGVTINSSAISANSLIYVTPLGSTNNQVLYVKAQANGSFTAGFDASLGQNVQFNWWIVN